jgi:hypothetical protein
MYIYVYKEHREDFNKALKELNIDNIKKGEYGFKSNTHTHSFRANYRTKIIKYFKDKNRNLIIQGHSCFFQD